MTPLAPLCTSFSNDDNPLPELASLSLNESARTYDLLKLLELGITDRQGTLVTNFSEQFPLLLADDQNKRVIEFLTKNQLTTLVGWVEQFYVEKGQPTPQAKIASEELYKVLGADFILQQCPLTKYLSQEVVSAFKKRCESAVENVSIYIPSFYQDKIFFTEELIGFLNTKFPQLKPQPFHNLQDKLSQFTIAIDTLKITFVISDSPYFAFADSLQVGILGNQLHLIDYGVRVQWAIDTLFGIVRFPQGQWKNQPYTLFRYIKQGYIALGNECQEQFAAKDLFALWKNSGRFVDDLLRLLIVIGHVNFSPTEVKMKSGTTRWIEMSWELIRNKEVTASDWQALTQLICLLRPTSENYSLFPDRTILTIANLQMPVDSAKALQRVSQLPNTLLTSPLLLSWIENFPTSAHGIALPPQDLEGISFNPEEPIGYLVCLAVGKNPLLIAKHFLTNITKYEKPLSEIVYKRAQNVLQETGIALPEDLLNGHFDTARYIEALLYHPVFQTVGFDLLTAQPGLSRLKIKWISNLQRIDENRARTLIEEVKDGASESQIRQWVQASRQTEPLVQMLLTDVRWQHVCVQIAPLFCLKRYFENREENQMLLQKIALQLDTHLNELLPHIFTAEAVTGAADLVTRALTILTTRKCHISEEARSQLKNQLSSFLTSLEKHKRHEELLLAIKVAHQYLSQEITTALIRALAEAPTAPKAIVNWYGTLVQTGVIAPSLLPELQSTIYNRHPTLFRPTVVQEKPEGKKPSQNSLQTMMQQKRWVAAANYVRENPSESKHVPTIAKWLASSPSADVQSQAVSLLEHFKMKSLNAWRSVFSVFLERAQFRAIAKGLFALASINEPELRDLFYEYATIDVLANEVALIEGFSEILQLFKGKKHEEKRRHLAVVYLQSAVKTKESLTPKALSELFDSLEHVVDTHPEKVYLATQLLIKSSRTAGSFETSCKFLQFILPYTKVQEVSRQKTKRPEKGQLVIVDNAYVEFMRQAKTNCQSPLCEPTLITLIKSFRARDISQLNTELITELHDIKLIEVRKELVFVLKSLLRTPMEGELTKAVATLLNSLFDELPIVILTDLYLAYINPEKKPLASLSKVPEVTTKLSEHKKNLNHKFSANEVFAAFMLYFETYLERCLTSPDPLDVRAALDVNLAVSMYNPAAFVEGFRSGIKNRYYLFPQLFAAHLEYYGWNKASFRLCQNIFDMILKPAFLKSHGVMQPLLHRQKFNAIALISPPLFSYQGTLLEKNDEDAPVEPETEPVEKMILPTLHIAKFSPDFFEGEKVYIDFIYQLIAAASQRVALTPKADMPLQSRARILDFTLTLLRNLVELYPRELHLQNFISIGISSRRPMSDFFSQHQQAYLGLLRQAVHKNVLEADDPLLENWLEELNISRKEFEAKIGFSDLMKQVEEYEARESITARQLFNLLTAILQRQDLEFTDQYEERDLLLQRLFSLLKKNTSLLLNKIINASIHLILAPRSVCVGVESDHASKVAERYLSMLFELYEKSPEQRQEYIAWILHGLNKTKIQGAFRNTFEQFAIFSRKFIKLIESDELEMTPHILDGFSSTIAEGVERKADVKARIALIDEWVHAMAKLYSSRPEYDIAMETIFHALVNAEVFSDLTTDHLEMLYEWMRLISPIKEMKEVPLDEMAIQICAAFIDYKDRKAMIEKFPNFIKTKLKFYATRVVVDKLK